LITIFSVLPSLFSFLLFFFHAKTQTRGWGPKLTGFKKLFVFFLRHMRRELSLIGKFDFEEPS